MSSLRNAAQPTIILAACLTIFVAAEAVAQEVSIPNELQTLRRDYIAAATRGDADALAAFFTADALVTTISGDTFRGTEAIRGYYEAAGPIAAMTITSTQIDALGDYIFDVGTFTVTLPKERGGEEVAAEYVALLEEEDGAWKLHRLLAFPPRRTAGPDAAMD